MKYYAIETENFRGEKFLEGRYRTRFHANVELADRMENACGGFKFRVVEIDESEGAKKSETIQDITSEMRDDVRTSRVNNPDPWARIFLSASNRAIEEYADRVDKAATMERLTVDGDYDSVILAKDEELERLRALVKEMAEGLKDCVEGFDKVYEAECVSYGTDDAYDNAVALIAKAKEVVK